MQNHASPKPRLAVTIICLTSFTIALGLIGYGLLSSFGIIHSGQDAIRILSLLVGSNLAILAIWLASHSYYSQFHQRLIEVARRIAQGDFSIQTGVKRHRTELDRLAITLDEMASTLQRKQEELTLSAEALRQSEARFRRMAENAQDLIYSIQLYPDQRYEYVSPAALALTGYTPEEHYADPELGSKYVHPDDLPKLKAIFGDYDVPTLPILMRWIRKDGRMIWVEQRHVPVYDENGERVSIEAIARDVTETKRSEELLQRLLDELKALHGVALAGTEAKTPDELIERATRIIGDALYPENFGVVLYNPGTNLLTPHSSFRYRNGLHSQPLQVGEGLVGLSAKTRKPMRVEDVSTESAYHEPDPEVRSKLVVPLAVDGHLLGVIDAESSRVGAFSEGDERLLSALAGELATAIEKVRLFDAERRRRQEAEMLRESAATLSSSLDLHQVLESILSYFERVVPYTSTSIMLLEGGRLQISAYRGFQSTAQAHLEINFEATPHIREVIQTGLPLIIADTHRDKRWNPTPESEYIHSWMGIPLKVKDRIIGLLNVDHEQPNSYTSDDTELALAFANQAAMAIENARLYEAERSRSQELAALTQVSSALRIAQNHEAMMPVILTQVIDLFNGKGAALGMRDLTTGDLIIEQAHGVWMNAEGLRIPSGKDISSQVLMTGRPYFTNQASTETRLYRPDLFAGVQSILAVPLTVQSQSVGLIYLGRQEPITENDIRLLTSIADIAANSIHRAALHEQTEQRLKRLSILRTLDMAITASIDVNFALKILLDETVSSLKTDAADVLMFRASTRTLEWREGHGFRNPDAMKSRLVLPALSNSENKLPAVRAVRERRTIFTPDLTQLHGERVVRLLEEGFIAEIAIPFIAKGQVKGLLEVFSRDPINPDREWMEFLESMAGQAAIALDNADLFENLERSNLDLSLAYDATIEGWARVLDLRDGETEDHSRRVTDITVALAREVNLPENELIHIRRGAFLHDIGKMGISDAILGKPGALTDTEWQEMRKHPAYAYEWLKSINYLKPALEIPYCHHEKWDGTGYPRNLRGEEIPLSARIFAIVDVWDALCHDRPYRKAWKADQVREYLREQTGKHFDPRIVEAFFRLLDKRTEQNP